MERRVEKTDSREIESYYKQYYKKYVLALNKGNQTDRWDSSEAISSMIIIQVNIYIIEGDINNNCSWQSSACKSLPDSWGVVWSALCC